MAYNHIRVYARIKKENQMAHSSRYELISDCPDGYDSLQTYYGGQNFKRKRRVFKFDKVFEPHSSQDDIFNIIAKPIIHDVFSGINATIFAYGATGSGKTYTLTGSQTKYEERGLIPRTIEYLFQLVTNKMSNYMFFISYLEIYNENAYDLLNPKQNITCIEELPRVIVLEDAKGEAHYKNLCLKEVNTEKEAMRLLYTGDN
ncbi:kinesin-like protein KIF6, partial [Atheta coriaria]|uniref:kinesin-like protein KIF6 n=1 Tax=Dalotia coriaria TaxID=877792 RepID=UPI0031F3796E